MSQKKIAILQSNYIPWKGYFDLIDSVDVFVIYDEVQYTKNDWRNRNLVKSKNGKEWMTVPVRQTSLHQRIDETHVALRNWNVKHWNTIVTNYAKAPAFAAVKDFVEDLYFGMPSYVNLSEINKHFIIGICNFLGVKTKIINSQDLNLKGDRNEKLVDACIKLQGNVYLSGPSAKEYLSTQLFNQNDIEIEWMRYSGYKEYPQLFPPFEHYVSILDVILNTGSSAYDYIKKDSI